jgi:hypothetical protein
MLREKYQQLQGYLEARPRLRGVARVLPFFAIGPISGPLVAGIVFNLKDGRPVLAGLYAVALVQYVVLLPVLVAKMGLSLI